MYAVYRSVVLENNSLGTVDITFINEFQFIFFYSSDVRNVIKCMDSMVLCYSLLNMKVIFSNLNTH